MDLKTLGFDQWFEDKRSEALRPDCTVARVTAVHKDSYLVRNEAGEVLAELAGNFAYSAESSIDLPAVGDWALGKLWGRCFYGCFALYRASLVRKA